MVVKKARSLIVREYLIVIYLAQVYFLFHLFSCMQHIKMSETICKILIKIKLVM